MLWCGVAASGGGGGRGTGRKGIYSGEAAGDLTGNNSWRTSPELLRKRTVLSTLHNALVVFLRRMACGVGCRRDPLLSEVVG